MQPKPAPPRRDVHLQHVIINEKADEKVAQHRVCISHKIDPKLS